MEKLKRLKWVILFFIILLTGGFLYSAYADFTLGMFQNTWNLISGLVILTGLAGFVWSAIKLKKKE